MRLLEQKKVGYVSHCYVDTGVVSGREVAEVLHQNPAQVFKTLVTAGGSGINYVFVLPCDKELDLKKSGEGCGGKEYRHDKVKGFAGTDGLHSRRLFAGRNEKAV